MPEQPAGPPADQSNDRRPRPAWSVALQIAVAALVAAVLIAGPQFWTFGQKLREDFRRWSAISWSRGPSAARNGPVVAPKGEAVRVASPTGEPRVAVIQRAPAPQRTEAQATPRPTKRARRPVPKPTPALVVAEPPSLTRQQYFDLLMKQGAERYQAGWYGPAAGLFRQAAAVMPSPTAYLWIGRSAIRAGRHHEARIALERAIQLAPDSAAAKEASALLDRMKSEKSQS